MKTGSPSISDSRAHDEPNRVAADSHAAMSFSASTWWSIARKPAKLYGTSGWSSWAAHIDR
jgi:hypothetical protein